MIQLLGFMVDEVGDVMYYDQVMNQPFAWELFCALAKEINGHVQNGDWKLIPCSKIPEEVEPVPSLWAMCRKTRFGYRPCGSFEFAWW